MTKKQEIEQPKKKVASKATKGDCKICKGEGKVPDPDCGMRPCSCRK